MRRILRGDLVRFPHRSADGVDTLQISEVGASAKLRKLFLRGVPASAYVIDMDAATCLHKAPSHRFPQFSAHFCRGAEAINKICDAALVWERETQIDVALVDLKSKSPSLSDTRRQLQNSQYFIDYVFSLVRWRDGETRQLRSTLHMIMVTNGKTAVGGMQQSARIKEYVGVHGVSVDSKGQASLRWQSFFS